MEASRVKTVSCLLLLFTCVQKTTPRYGVDLSKRQADPEGGITNISSSNPNKDVNEEAFSVEFSGEDYNTLISLLLDAKNEFLKLRGNSSSSSRPLDVNTTDVADAAPVDVQPSVDENATAAVPVEEDPGLKNAVTENPVTPDPGVASPSKQLETVPDRNTTLKVTVTPVTNAPVATGPASETPQGEVLFEGDSAADVTLKPAEPNTCIPQPVQIQLPYPPVPPPLLYSPPYLPCSIPQDGYVYPQVYYQPDSEYPYPPEGTAPPPGYYPPVPDNLAPQARAEVVPATSSSVDASFTNGECISYFCSAYECTAWECTSEPCTSGICVAKRCVQWSCDAWSNSSLTKVQDADWVAQPPEAQYYDPLNGV